MAGTVDFVQRGQTALEFRDDAIWISPCLPTELQGLYLKLLYRGYWLYVQVDCDEFKVSAPDGWAGPKQIGVRNQLHAFKGGDTLTFACDQEPGGFKPNPEMKTRTTEKSM